MNKAKDSMNGGKKLANTDSIDCSKKTKEKESFHGHQASRTGQNILFTESDRRKTHCFIGNADTNVLLRGSKDDIYNEVKRCMDIGKNCPGFFMAVGNHIPSNTPVENALWYNECYEKLSKR